MPRTPGIDKVLLIGSGPIVIGQAAEFDYAGTQACRALREEGVTTVLVNSNPATIMTDEGIADVTYIEPLTVEVLERIIARERPAGLLGTLGGQTGLNLSVALHERGVLQKYGVQLLGTSVESIQAAEDRELFKQLLLRLGEPVPPSCTVCTVAQGIEASQGIGLPVVVRPAFTLGGSGGGVAWRAEQLTAVIAAGLAASPVGQVLIEQYLLGYKEVEYEVVRDAGDTCITVCNMENFDPVGVHTGDSIVVAPSQTLSDREYHLLRAAALRIVRALAVQGGCNVQFAVDPRSSRYFVIEVNPRVSRSSALASKATGYPIARVATQVALGYRLHEIKNAVTGRTSAAFEPALDYVVVKIPRWPFDKFPGADRSLGTQMKATGEVMAIDRTFEAALHKALRSLELKPDEIVAGAEPQDALARIVAEVTDDKALPKDERKRLQVEHADNARPIHGNQDESPLRLGGLRDEGVFLLQRRRLAQRDRTGAFRNQPLDIGDQCFGIARRDLADDGAIVRRHATPPDAPSPRRKSRNCRRRSARRRGPRGG